MVGPWASDVQHLRDEVRRLRGRVDAVLSGAQVIPSSISGFQPMPAPQAGAIIYGSAVPSWVRLSISVPAANVRNVLGADNGDTLPAWKTALDSTNPTTIAASDASAPGTSLIFAHRDHRHGAPATFPATAHNILSLTHGDSTAAAAVRGDLITAQGASPTWSRLAASVPAANVRNVLGLDNGDTEPAWKTALDAVAPTTAAASDAPAAGTSLIFAHRDHRHGMPASFDTPHALLDGVQNNDTLAAAPVAGDLIIGNATPKWARLAIAVPAANVRNVLGTDNGDTLPSWKTALDSTNPTTIAAADAPAPGTSLIFAHRDHRHGAPASFDTPHALLDGTQNNDTLAGAPTRGDVIVANATPKWARVAVGAAGSVFWTDGTDSTWTTNPKVAGYLRVGSASAPTNITAGDATTTRLLVGTDTAFANSSILEVNQASNVPPGTTSAAAYVTSILAPAAGAGITHGALLAELFVRPTAADGGSYRAGEFNVSHDSGAFDLTGTLIALRGSATQAVAATTIGELRGINVNMVVSAGSATTVNGIVIGMILAGGATIGTYNALVLNANSFPTTLTLARGVVTANYGNASVVTAVGIEVAAITGATNNFAIRNAGNMVQVGYMRIGASTAPLAVTDGDLTVLRISLANTAFGTGGEFIVAQQSLATTAAGADVFYGFNPIIGPASASSTQYRIWQQTAQMGTGAGTLNIVTNMFLRNDHRGTSTVTIGESTGINVVGLELTSSSNATPGNVTTAKGIYVQTLQGSGSKVVTTVTTAVAIDIFSSIDTTTSFTNVTTMIDIRIGASSTAAVITTRLGIQIANVASAGTITTAVGIDIAAITGATNNFDIRAGGSSVFGGYVRVGGVTIPTNVTAGDLTAVRAIFGADASLASGPVVMVNAGTLGGEVFRIASVATNDDPSERVFQNRAATTDATVTTLHTYTLPASTTALLVAYVTARRTGGTSGTAEDGAAYTIIAAVKNVAGVATLIGVVNALSVMEDQVAWDATIDVTGATARVRITGAANNNVTWHVTLRVLPVGT